MKRRMITAILMAIAIGLGATAHATDLESFRGKVRKYAPDFTGGFTGPKKTFCRCTDGGTYNNGIGWTYQTLGNPIADLLIVKSLCVVPRYEPFGAATGPAFCNDFELIPK